MHLLLSNDIANMFTAFHDVGEHVIGLGAYLIPPRHGFIA
jgi:hypothetical protein